MKPIDFSLQMASSKPLPYDAEVEYLRSKYDRSLGKSPFIETNYHPWERSQFDFKYSLDEYYHSRNPEIIGAKDDDNKQFDLWCDGSSWATSFSFKTWLGSYRINPTQDYLIPHTIVANRNELTVDGEVVKTYTGIVDSARTANPLVMFKYGCFTIYYLKISEDGKLVLDMIPVRFTNENGVSEGAMYDRVSGQLFRNEGTGAFIIGPDVSSAAQNYPPPQS